MVAHLHFVQTNKNKFEDVISLVKKMDKVSLFSLQDLLPEFANNLPSEFLKTFYREIVLIDKFN